MTGTIWGLGLLFQSTLLDDAIEWRGQLCQTLTRGRGGRVPPCHPDQHIEGGQTGLAEWRFPSSGLVNMQTGRLVEDRQIVDKRKVDD
jgi:hypothetical protein